MTILGFLKDASNLKNIPRQGWIDKLSISHPESVADHSYSMSIMAMIISDLENYDSEKILKMVLLHDLAESKIGDFTPGQISKDEKEKIENQAFHEIIEKLPNSITLEYTEIWKEYQKQISVESQFVHQIDRLEMALQAKMYEKSGSSKENIVTFLQTAKSDITHPKLKELFTKIVED
jgi:putative hydrolases of HD superfamily